MSTACATHVLRMRHMCCVCNTCALFIVLVFPDISLRTQVLIRGWLSFYGRVRRKSAAADDFIPADLFWSLSVVGDPVLWVIQPKILGREKNYFRRAKVFCLGCRFLKHNKTRYCKNLGCMAPWLHLCGPEKAFRNSTVAELLVTCMDYFWDEQN